MGNDSPPSPGDSLYPEYNLHYNLAEGGGPDDPSLEVTMLYSSLYFFLNPFLWLKHTCWEFPGGPWLGLTFTAGALGLIPSQGTKIPQAAQHG